VVVIGARTGAAGGSATHQVLKQFGSSGWCSPGSRGDNLHVACLLPWQQ